VHAKFQTNSIGSEVLDRADGKTDIVKSA